MSRRIRLGEEPEVAKFNEIRALAPANSAAVRDVTTREAVELYLQPLLYGLFSPTPPPVSQDFE
ncbi:MAG: hypothetical protein ABIT36_12250 [Steroidobacteraceae bacterium]